MDELKRKTSANSRFAKAGVLCFYDSEVLNLNFVHLMKFSAKKSPPSQSGKPLCLIVGRHQINR